MIRLHIIAEGTTEETFIRELLSPALRDKQVYATWTVMNGDVRYSRVKSDVVTRMKSDQGISTARRLLGWSSSESRAHSKLIPRPARPRATQALPA